jgi:hypothetical protein
MRLFIWPFLVLLFVGCGSNEDTFRSELRSADDQVFSISSNEHLILSAQDDVGGQHIFSIKSSLNQFYIVLVIEENGGDIITGSPN